MISTKNIIAGIQDVPAEWVFENYLGLAEKLTGQDVKIHSVFQTEKTPSMFIYFKSGDEYKFKDFSSGKQGSKITLVSELFNLTYGEAVNKICADYELFLKDNNYTHVDEYKIQNKYRVIDYEIRHWTNVDAKFWTKFKIDSKVLDEYNVSGLSYFKWPKKETRHLILHSRVITSMGTLEKMVACIKYTCPITQRRNLSRFKTISRVWIS